MGEIPPHPASSNKILAACLSWCSGGEEDLDKDGGCFSVRIQCSEEWVWITVQGSTRGLKGLCAHPSELSWWLFFFFLAQDANN